MPSYSQWSVTGTTRFAHYKSIKFVDAGMAQWMMASGSDASQASASKGNHHNFTPPKPKTYNKQTGMAFQQHL